MASLLLGRCARLISLSRSRAICCCIYLRCDRYNGLFATCFGVFMSVDTAYQNNPLHGVSLKKLLTEMVDYYGFEILFSYLNINCFDKNPSIDSSVKFLKKTDWAREKVEAFYLYKFKSLPRASPEQFELPPRDRIIPQDQTPGKPAELSLEDAERLSEKRAKKAADYHSNSDKSGSNYSRTSNPRDSDPWAKWKK